MLGCVADGAVLSSGAGGTCAQGLSQAPCVHRAYAGAAGAQSHDELSSCFDCQTLARALHVSTACALFEVYCHDTATLIECCLVAEL
jgi:hypothetical protein